MDFTIINFLKKNKFYLLCLAAVLWVSVFSLQTLTTKPRLWFDEGINIELARNFSLFGKLDVIVRPETFSGQPFLLQSTGYPITLPLALFFKIFGFGVFQARLYMLFWMLALLLSIFFIGRKIFGLAVTAWSLMLVATLPPFFANGRCVMGEIPGFFFLLLGIYWLWYRRKDFFAASGIVSGFFLGLAVVSKPSIYLLVLPAVWLVLLLQKDQFWKKFLTLGFGIFWPALLWIVLAMPQIFSPAGWLEILSFYRQPFGGVSAWGNIVHNIIFLFSYSALIYFSALFLVILAAIFWNKNFYSRYKNFLNFTIVYCIFAFIYFLKSPGWLRYIVAGQLLILLFLPVALKELLDKINFKLKINNIVLLPVVLLLLISWQWYYLVYRSDLFYSDNIQAVWEFIKTQPADKTVGIINSPPMAALIDPVRKFQMIKMMGLPVFGENPLALKYSDLPDLIIANNNSEDFKKYQVVAEQYYKLVKSVGKNNIYSLSL